MLKRLFGIKEGGKRDYVYSPVRESCEMCRAKMAHIVILNTGGNVHVHAPFGEPKVMEDLMKRFNDEYKKRMEVKTN